MFRIFAVIMYDVIDYLASTPSPEQIYIGSETTFLRVIEQYNSGHKNIAQLIYAYVILCESEFDFSEIKLRYEKIIDDNIDLEKYHFYLNEKKEKTFNILKQKYYSLTLGKSKRYLDSLNASHNANRR